jgi:hypothetical protein
MYEQNKRWKSSGSGTAKVTRPHGQISTLTGLVWAGYHIVENCCV